MDLASKMGDLLDSLCAAFETGETENWEHGLSPSSEGPKATIPVLEPTG
ncbi:MAG TPA: hypothetical protein VFP89_12930 [Propionibacteriaceae bacterium]|nr:hypothetical protein [Propionibacteriaceae bacterium]